MFREKHDFLSEKVFAALCAYAKTAKYKDEENPVDGVVYPLVCKEVPEQVHREIAFMAGRKPNFLFLRRSPAGVHIPQEVHSDIAMGKTSLMVYLSDGPGGTSFLVHRVLGVAKSPKIESVLELCRQSENNRDAWSVHSYCKMEANKACIFDSDWYHRAEPVGGYGDGESSRCVLTGFFD